MKMEKQSITGYDLQDEYDKWKNHRNNHWFFHWAKPYTASQAMAKQHDQVVKLMEENQDALYNLIFSGEITDERELYRIIFFAGHGGSCSKKDNLHWIPFLQRLRERSSELPYSIQVHFEWLGKVHHYWD